jgi:3-ketosteroid 9alpha-monooxygenase subunit B
VGDVPARTLDEDQVRRAHGYHLLGVKDVVQETHDTRSFVLDVPAELADRFAYAAGQFCTFRVRIAGEQHLRSYSMSSAPETDRDLTVTVKRVPGGVVSNWFNDRVAAGDVLELTKPAGAFCVRDGQRPVVAFCGGSGITPVMSITRTAIAHGSGRIVLFYANRDESSVIFAKELSALAAAHPDRLVVIHWLESVQGLPTQEQMKSFIEPFTTYDAFVCGPGPFMKLTIAALRELDFPRERRHQERFVSLGGNPFGDAIEVERAEHELEDAEADDAFTDGAPAAVPEPGPEGPVHLEVELDGQTYVYDDWQPGTKLLEHLESKGVKAPYSCREGECSACAVRLLEGEVKMQHNDVLDDEDLAEGIRLGCQSLPVTDVVRVTYH